ncbi:MAG: glycosyltransferase [Candidatus Binatia bacterium]|nr:glycosyltransferase [Candidatus Binatia bacterium]
MRIAVAVHGYPPAGCGGVERVASEQAEALAARRHSLFVFCRDPIGDGEEGATRDETVGGVSVRRVVVRDGARSSFSEYYEGDFLDRSFRRFLEDVRPDVLHVQHLVSLSTRLLDVAREAGIPVVLSLHDAYFLCHRLFLIDAQGERCPGPDAGLRCVGCLAEHGVGDLVRQRFDAMARRLDRVEKITAPSPSLRARYEEEFPFLRGRIEIVEPGISQRPPVEPRERRDDGTPLRLLFAGTLMPHKGLDVLIDAFDRLSEADFELTVHGEDVTVGDTWAQKLRDRTANRAVHWRGAFPPSELAGVLGRADVLVLPSRCDESWSRVVREARVAGLAVVAPKTGGPADWLRDGEDALLVEPGSVAALVSALARLRADPELRAALSSPVTGVPTVAEAATILEGAFAQVISSRGRTAPLAPTRVTVAYVTKNGGSCIEESLRAVRAQKGPFELVEILAVDSGSTDETLGVLSRHGAHVVQISPDEFGHGRTRNLAAREAKGDVVAFLTQDAAPADEHWLGRLIGPLEEDPLCAATWSRHVPRPECHPMEWRMLTEHPPFRPGVSAIQSARGNPDYAANPDGQCSLSNNGAAYRREDLLHRPFPDVSFAEDRAWARDALEAGWRTVLVRDSILRHSHSYSAWVNLRRNFDHWRAMAEELGQADGFTLMQGWRASAREARNDLRFWSDHTGRSAAAVALRWGVPATLYHLGAFTGRWLGSHTKWLPPGVPDRLSMHRMPDSTGSKS